MKSLVTFITCMAFSALMYAQTLNNTVTINYSGQNRQVLIDGKVYTPTSDLTIVTNDLAAGRHSLEVVRNNDRKVTETFFTLRKNYDLNITIAANGSVKLEEVYRDPNTTTTSNSPMNATAFNTLLQKVKNTTQPRAKINLLNVTFSNPDNFFTTNQARRLINLVTGESFRLQLAKAAVRSITDTRNIYNLTGLLNSTKGRNELNEYIRDYEDMEVEPSTTGTPSSAMTDANFAVLLNDIRNMWQSGAKLTAISNAFSGSNRFTTNQVVQLIQQLSSEGERLRAAKLSYNTIVDQGNFSQVYNLLGTQASRDELANYIRNPNAPVVPGNVAMSDANYNQLYERVRGLWLPGAKKQEILSIFANTSNFFTVHQAARLIILDNDERDRLDMAKASLRSLVDPQNMTPMYNIFSSQSSRDELSAYVRNFYNTAGTVSGNTNVRTPMSDANFSILLEQTRKLWLPGAKKAAVLDAFAGSSYFTTAQAIQLIQLDNDERDRLDMAKASYRTITDPQNFSQVYALFRTQAYINDLAAYVRSIQ